MKDITAGVPAVAWKNFYKPFWYCESSSCQFLVQMGDGLKSWDPGQLRAQRVEKLLGKSCWLEAGSWKICISDEKCIYWKDLEAWRNWNLEKAGDLCKLILHLYLLERLRKAEDPRAEGRCHFLGHT